MSADHSPSEFAHLIRSRRIVRGMSQARLGAKVDRTATTVRRWERGESLPTDDVLDGLAEALEVPRSEIDAALAAALPEPEPAASSELEPAAVPEPEPVPPPAASAEEAPAVAVTSLPLIVDPEVPTVEPDTPPAEADVEPAEPDVEPAEPDVEPDVEPAVPDVERAEPDRDGGAAVLRLPPPTAGEAAGPEGDGGARRAAPAAAVAAPPVVVHAAESGIAAADVLDAGAEVDLVVAGATESVGSEALPWIDVPTETILAPPPPQPAAEGPDGDAALGGVSEPTQPTPAPRRTAPSPATTAPAAAQMMIIDKSYIEDRWQRLLYGLRLVLTVVALAVMAIILAWAAIELWDAIGAVLDLFGEQVETPDGVVES